MLRGAGILQKQEAEYHFEKTHFIGIGGAGMSGLAKILLEKGIPVSGSDCSFSPVVESLQEMGAVCFQGHAAENIADDVKLVVYSSAIRQNNPEIVAAKEKGIEVVCRAELLARLMLLQTGISVAGTHGKSTTTGMLSTILLHTKDMAPTVVGGAYLPQIHGNAQLGAGKYLVAESDESDGSFLLLHPQLAIVTNIEVDHLDHYGSYENVLQGFTDFLNQLPENGFAMLNIDSPGVREILPVLTVKDYLTYSVESQEGDIYAEAIAYHGRGSSFSCIYQGKSLGPVELSVPGIYNVSNALAAIGVALQIGVSWADILTGLKAFQGVGRRFEILGVEQGVTVVDDYAHHPTEIKATLAAAKNMGYKRIIGVFQPHRYSRTQALFEEFTNSFLDSDELILNSIYAASEDPIPGVSGKGLAEAIRQKHSGKVDYYDTHEEILTDLVTRVKDGDLVIMIGAGNLRQVGIQLIKALQGGGK